MLCSLEIRVTISDSQDAVAQAILDLPSRVRHELTARQFEQKTGVPHSIERFWKSVNTASASLPLSKTLALCQRQ